MRAIRSFSDGSMRLWRKASEAFKRFCFFFYYSLTGFLLLVNKHEAFDIGLARMYTRSGLEKLPPLPPLPYPVLVYILGGLMVIVGFLYFFPKVRSILFWLQIIILTALISVFIYGSELLWQSLFVPTSNGWIFIFSLITTVLGITHSSEKKR